MTALSESLLLMLICDIFSLSILTYLHFSWVGKPVLDTMLTSELNFERIQSPQHTSAFSQTQIGSLIMMGYFATLVESMSQTLKIFNFVCSSIHMTTHLQDILVRQRCSTKPNYTIIGLDFSFTSRTTENHAPSVP